MRGIGGWSLSEQLGWDRFLVATSGVRGIQKDNFKFRKTMENRVCTLPGGPRYAISGEFCVGWWSFFWGIFRFFFSLLSATPEPVDWSINEFDVPIHEFDVPLHGYLVQLIN